MGFTSGYKSYPPPATIGQSSVNTVAPTQATPVIPRPQLIPQAVLDGIDPTKTIGAANAMANPTTSIAGLMGSGSNPEQRMLRAGRGGTQQDMFFGAPPVATLASN